MHAPKILVGGIFVLWAAAASAQSASSSLAPAEKTSSATAAKAPKKKTRFFAPKRSKAFKQKRGNVKHSAQYEFYERIERAAREKQKIMKILARKQYSDPSYFGHKKKPKRRPPHKMRLCDECQIRH